MKGWPARLTDGEIVLRPLQVSDAREWRQLRLRNASWLKPWDATVPPGAAGGRATTFRALARRLVQLGKEGSAMPFVLEVSGQFAGQVTVNNIVRGSAQFASIGYWLDREYAGRGIMARAVAMAIDHCFFTAGLHRIEIAIRPENVASLRVVEKLGIQEYGYARRYLHIDGDWRDHRLFAVNRDEAPFGMLRKLDSQQSQE